MTLMPFPVILKNGQTVLIREVMPADRHLLEIGYAHLSDQSRYFRFLAVRHDLTTKELDRFTAANGPDHVAVGALVEGAPAPEPVGIARYIRLPDNSPTAEIALTIVDSYQHQGLGSLLLGVLARFAQLNTITEFAALVHCKNKAMLGLLGQLGGTQTLLGGAEIEITIPVARASTLRMPSSVTDRCMPARVGSLGAVQQAPSHTSEHWINLRKFVHVHPQMSGVSGTDQSASVWVDDGGAII